MQDEWIQVKVLAIGNLQLAEKSYMCIEKSLKNQNTLIEQSAEAQTTL